MEKPTAKVMNGANDTSGGHPAAATIASWTAMIAPTSENAQERGNQTNDAITTTSDHTHTVVMPMIGNNTKVNAQNARIVTTRTAGRSNQTIGGMARNPR